MSPVLLVTRRILCSVADEGQVHDHHALAALRKHGGEVEHGGGFTFHPRRR